MNCSHSVINSGICHSCGEYVSLEYSSDLYSTNHTPAPQQTSTFNKIVNELDIPQNVKIRTIGIHDDMKKTAKLKAETYAKSHGIEDADGKFTHRSGKLTQVIFACLFYAYQELGDKQDPKIIAKMVGLPINKMATALGTCKESITGYRLDDSYTDPLDILPQYYNKLGLDPSNYSLLKQLAEYILDKSPSLRDDPPLNVAGAILTYYCNINGVTIGDTNPINLISDMLECSNMTIKNIVERIETIDNQ